MKPLRLTWHLYTRHEREAYGNEHDGSYAKIGPYRLDAIQYATSKWKAIVWLGHDTVGFRNEQRSEIGAQRAAESLVRELLKRESMRLERMRRRIG